MDTSLSITCPEHKMNILNICTAQECKERLLCLYCFSSHPTQHETYISSIDEALSLDIDDLSQSRAKEIQDENACMVITIETFFDTLRDKFLGIIEELRSSYLLKHDILDRISNFESIKSEFENSRTKLMNEGQGNIENLKIFADDFVKFKKLASEQVPSSEMLLEPALRKIDFVEKLDIKSWILDEMEEVREKREVRELNGFLGSIKTQSPDTRKIRVG